MLKENAYTNMIIHTHHDFKKGFSVNNFSSSKEHDKHLELSGLNKSIPYELK